MRSVNALDSAVLDGEIGVSGYRIDRRLGDGAEGGAFVGTELGTGTRVVLKQVGEAERAAVRHAFEVLRRSGSPHLPAPLGLVPAADGSSWLITEFVVGEPLTRGPVEPLQAVRDGCALAHALAALHGCGTHHADISPRNVIVRSSGELILIDLARLGRRGMGTPGFLAPEVLAGGGGPEADRFSLGCVLCFRLFGVAPWVAPDALVEVRHRADVETRLLQLGSANLPEGLHALLVRLLQPDPRARPHQTSDLLRRLLELKSVLEGRGTLQRPTWWIPARVPYQGVALTDVVAKLMGPEPPPLVLVAGPAGSGRGRVVEEIIQAVGRAGGASRLVDPQRLAVQVGRPTASWIEAWLEAPASWGVLGCRDGGPWPSELEGKAGLRAQILETTAAMAHTALVVPCESEVARKLVGRADVVCLETRPWTRTELAQVVELAIEDESLDAWISVIAAVTGGWPGSVLQTLAALASADVREPIEHHVETALETFPGLEGATLSVGLANALLTADWCPDSGAIASLPSHFHDGDYPLRHAVAMARRTLGAVGVRDHAHDLLAAGEHGITLPLAVAAGRAELVDELLRDVQALDNGVRGVEALSEWLQAEGRSQVSVAVLVLAARWKLRVGDAAGALQLVDRDDPRCRIEGARALQRLGRFEEALVRLEGVPSDDPMTTGLRWRILTDLGHAAVAVSECHRRPPAGTGVGPATAMLWGGYASLVVGDRVHARRLLASAQAALGAAADLESAAIRARIVQLLGNLAHAEGDLRSASEAFATAVAAFEDAQEGMGVLMARGSLAALAIPTLDLARGLELGWGTVRGLLGRGQLDALPEASLNLTQLLLRVGRRDEARVLHDAVGNLLQSCDLSPRSRARWRRLDADVAAANVSATPGIDASAIEAMYRSAAASLGDAGLGREAADTWCRAACWARRRGQLELARTSLTAAEQAAVHAGDRYTNIGVALERLACAALGGVVRDVEDALAKLSQVGSFTELRRNEALDLCWAHDVMLLGTRAFWAASSPSVVARLGNRLSSTLEVIMNKTAPVDRIGAASSLLHEAESGSGIREILADLNDVDGSGPRGQGRPTATPAGARASEASRLERLLRLHRRFASEDRLDALLEQVVDAVMDLTEAERGAVVVRGRDGVRLEVTRELVRGTDGFKFSHSVIERVLAIGEAVLSVDASADERFGASESISHLNLRSVLAVPLRFRGTVLGAVYVDHRLRRGNFDEDDLRGMEAFADLAALAVAHAGALAEVRTQAEALQTQGRELATLLEAREAEVVELREEVRHSATNRSHYRGIVGSSPTLQKVFRMIDRLANAAVPVVVCGESGTGKELVARAIHAAGARASGPFVAENCGAIPEALLESILFGHAKGAFTGAHAARPGLFEAADNGTIFLDEISEMSLAMQTKLLRVLQEGEVRRVGETASRAIRVRVIAASHRDLEAMVREGTFRQDLYYRIHVVRLDLPALRQRTEDIPALIAHFVERHGPNRSMKLTAPARRALVSYPWPGNVRELENEVQRWLALCDDTVDIDDLAPAIVAVEGGLDPDDLRLRPRVERLERDLIGRALERCAGNQTKAAELLGLSRFGLQKKLRRFEGEGEGDGREGVTSDVE